MSLDLLNKLDELDVDAVASLSDDDLVALANEMLEVQSYDRQVNQLRYYLPVSEKAVQVHTSNAKVFFLAGGNGACLPLTAPVMMADGTYQPLGKIQVGDIVMAADPATREAVPAPVTNTFRSGVKEVYRVTFSDGGSFEASAEHQVPLLLGSGRTTSKGNPMQPHKRPLGQYLEAMAKRGPAKRISAVSPRRYEFTQPKPLTVPPYLLGLLLGDGCLTARGIRFSNTDQNVLREIARYIEPYGLTLKFYGGCDYGLTGSQCGGYRNPLTAELRELGLMGTDSYTKFIPKHYLTAGEKDRKALLAGLVDTDGGKHSYASCSKRLADGFVFLVKSLGGKATCSPRTAKCQTGASVDYFQIYWRLTEKLPLAVPRKQSNTHTRQIDYTRRVCRSVESLGLHECGDIEVGHPAHCYITGDYVIVSNSKTDTALVDMVIRATGQIPASLKADYPRAKLRGPINCRVVVESITNTLETIILPKLQWWKWQGVDEPGGPRGHYGWVPKHCLLKGEWDESWTARTRTLELVYRDPDTDEPRGFSRIQFMSYDQDPSDFASGDFHFVLHDEPPKEMIWVENLVRAKRVNGTMFLSMTWPDDPTIPVDWIIDRVYEPCLPGNDHDPTYEMVEMYATENRNLDQNAIAEMARSLSAAERQTRIYGKHLRLSNRVHPLFTDTDHSWCFTCHDLTVKDEAGCCGTCHGDDVVEFNHVVPQQANASYPVVCLLDPHPRKPHMLIWVQVTPDDDYRQIAELEVDGSPDILVERVQELEQDYGWSTIKRIMDPNMGRSPSSTDRETTWQDAFEQAGLVFDLADDSEVGRQTLNDLMKPDALTRTPRWQIDPRCMKSIYQFKRYSWDDYKKAAEKDIKQRPKQKNDDFPTLNKYLANAQVTFRGLKSMNAVARPYTGQRKNGY
jgi:hypothetical protein